MSERKNISGEFPIEANGKEYTLKMTYGAAERIEQFIIGRSIMELLTEALNGRAKISDVVNVFYACLSEKDRDNVKKEDFGQAIMSAGLKKYAKTHTSILTYAMTGDTEPKTQTGSKKN